jgi:WD40 repeat protein
MGPLADADVQAWAAAHARSVPLHGGSAQPAAGDLTRAGSVTPSGTWRSHTAGVWSLACAAPAGPALLVATGSDDGSVRTWDGISDAARQTFGAGTGPVVSLAWAPRPDVQPLLASSSAGGEVRVWDVRTGELAYALTGLSGYVRSLSWMEFADGRILLVTGGTDGSVRAWDGSTGAAHRILAGHARVVSSVACASGPAERPLVASGSRDGTVSICDGRSGVRRRILAGHTDDVSSVAWADLADGALLASGDQTGAIRVWDGLTGTLLHTLTGHGGRIRSIGWAVLPDGSALLASTSGDAGGVRVWDGRAGVLLHTLTGYPPVLSLAWAAGPGGRLLVMGADSGEVYVGRLDHGPQEQHAAAGTVAPVAPLDLPEIPANPVKEVVPAGWAVAAEGPASSVAWAVAGGRALLATGSEDGARVWDGSTGALLLTLGHDQPVQTVAWAVQPDESPLLATGSDDGLVRVWDGHEGALLLTLAAHTMSVRSVAWAVLPDGRLRLASGSDDGAARVWDVPTGDRVADLSPGGRVWSVAWAVPPDGGPPLLATSSAGSRVTVWDGHSGAQVRKLSGHTADVNSVAWAVLPDGRLRLASGSDDGTTRVWDGSTGALLHTFTEASGAVFSVRWALPDGGQLMLATAGRFDGNTTRIWDGRGYALLASLPGTRGIDGGLAWASLPDGRQLLAATPGMSQQRARLWDATRIVPGSQPPPARRLPAVAAALPAPARTLRLAEAGLFALGRADLWPPLGLVEDLVTLTGPASAAALKLNDVRLRALGQHPGMRRLQALGWPARARLSFAALLASGITPDAAYQPPAGAQSRLRDALIAALAGPRPVRAADVDLDELRASASAVDDRTVALLTILGPGTAAADPVLPLLLSHQAPRLPVLSGNQLRMLSEVTRSGTAGRRETDGGLQHAPGTAGIGRHGELSQLLPTQLALPADMLTARYLQGHLLYRRHMAHIPVLPERVTLILDTTPPTYGSAENILRLTAHLVTTVLWEFGEHPELVSLAQPAAAVPLTGPANLAQLWTTRTLDPPGPAIATAMDTARATGTRMILLTHHHTADRWFLPGPGRQLLTTHHPAEQPPAPPSRPDHYHLPPNPAQTLLLDTIWSLITPRSGL